MRYGHYGRYGRIRKEILKILSVEESQLKEKFGHLGVGQEKTQGRKKSQETASKLLPLFYENSIMLVFFVHVHGQK